MDYMDTDYLHRSRASDLLPLPVGLVSAKLTELCHCCKPGTPDYFPTEFPPRKLSFLLYEPARHLTIVLLYPFNSIHRFGLSPPVFIVPRESGAS